MRRLSFLASCAVLIFSMGVPSAFAGNSPNGKPFVAINDQIIEVKGAVSSIQDQIDNLIGRIDTLEGVVTASQAATQTLAEQNQILQTLIATNLTTLYDIENKIVDLELENQSLKDMLANMGPDPELEAQIAGNKNLITTLQGALLEVENDVISLDSNLQQQIENNQQVMTALQEQITTINSVLTFQQNLSAGICPDGNAITDVLEDGTVICAAAGGGVSGALESVHAFNDPAVSVPPAGQAGSTALAVAFCPDGYFVTSAGFNQSGGLIITNIQTSPKNYAYVWGRNTTFTTQTLTAVANCTRIAP